MQLPERASSFAASVDALLVELSWMSAAVFGAVVVCIAMLAWRGRPRSAAYGRPPLAQRAFLVALVVASYASLAHLFHAGLEGFVRMSVPPPNAITIRVEAFQWGWRFQQPNGLVESELWVPRGEPVRLVMSSLPRGPHPGQGAVIHGLYIPAFRVQRDIVPGMYTSLWFEATHEGVHDIFCSSFCGVGEPLEGAALADDLRVEGRPTAAAGHSGMLSRVHVVGPEEYEAHVNPPGCFGLAYESYVDWGRELFQQNGCNACHLVEPGAPATVGPNLAGVAGTNRSLVESTSVRADADYLRESIREPQARVVDGFTDAAMPSFAGLGEMKIDALVAYVGSLSEHGAPVVQAIEAAHPAE